MPRTLIRKDPSNFKTLQLFVEASPEGLNYQGLGMPLNFAQMLEKRKPVAVADNQRFAVELANLGVSVRLTLCWQGREYWVLVRQRRADRGDVVLKLISGYVPAHELNLPLLTAIQEVAEECLLETPEGWLSGRFGDTWLPTPYQHSLRYRETAHFSLSPLSGAARPVQCGNLKLLERPRAYVHLPTASLQLVYDLRLDLPKETRGYLDKVITINANMKHTNLNTINDEVFVFTDSRALILDTNQINIRSCHKIAYTPEPYRMFMEMGSIMWHILDNCKDNGKLGLLNTPYMEELDLTVIQIDESPAWLELQRMEGLKAKYKEYRIGSD